MPLYRYRAKDWEGRTHQGTVREANRRAAVEQLRSEGLVILDVREFPALETEKLFSFKLSSFKPRAKKPRARDYMFFCRQFSTMIAAGVTVLDAVRLLSQQSEHPGLRQRLQDIGVQLEQGKSLYESFTAHADFFPPLLVSMVEAGEAGGVLDTVMERLALYYQKQHNLEEKIRAATTYPLVITIVAVAVVSFLVFFVLPSFAEIFSNMGLKLPWVTRLLIAAGRGVGQYWYILAALLGGTWAAARRYAATEKGREKFDRLRLRLPLYGPIYHKNLMARFSRNLGILLASGVELLTALELVERIVHNTVISQILERTREVVRRGESIADPLAEGGTFSPMVVQMVKIGEETGALDSMLARAADFYESEVSYVIERLSSVLEPALLIALGIVVGIIVISIITPMFEIYQMI